MYESSDIAAAAVARHAAVEPACLVNTTIVGWTAALGEKLAYSSHCRVLKVLVYPFFFLVLRHLPIPIHDRNLHNLSVHHRLPCLHDWRLPYWPLPARLVHWSFPRPLQWVVGGTVATLLLLAPGGVGLLPPPALPELVVVSPPLAYQLSVWLVRFVLTTAAVFYQLFCMALA